MGWGTVDRFGDKQNLEVSARSEAEKQLAKNDDFLPTNITVLRSLAQFAYEKNIRVLFFTSPAYKAYVQQLDKNQLNKTINEAKAITNKYSNTYYFNLLSDSDFDSNDFYDADHLDEIGAKKLSLKLDSLIREVRMSPRK